MASGVALTDISSNGVAKLDGDEKGVALTDTLGGRQEMQIISEFEDR